MRAGGILGLEERVSVTEEAGKCGGSHHGSNNLERLENRWFETKKKLDH